VPVLNIEPNNKIKLLNIRRYFLSGALFIIGPISRIPLGTRADLGASSMLLLISPLVLRLRGLKE
jgi:hypothetical protein